MGMTETEMIGVIVLACLVTAVIVRLLVGFAQRETDLRDCGDSGLYLDTGIAQTMGNKEIQSDRVRAERTQAGALAVIADGIGKRNIGEVCAQIAMDTILDRYEPYTFLSEPDHFFRMSFYEANRRVQMTLERSKGGTSLGAVFVNGTKLYYALAGNIRIALFRGGEIIPLSKGHTLDVLAEEAWKDGKISRQEAVWSMEEKRMWNYVGMDGFRKIEVESQPILTRPEDVVMRSYCPTFRANLNQLRRAMDVLVTSRKPLIVAGGGVIMANAAEELCTLAHLMHAPVCSTLMGLGAFPGDDPLWIGMLGMHGTFAANRAVTQADVILAVGARFDDRVTGKLSQFAPNARIVHIDIDPTTLRKNVRVEVPVVSDALSALQGLRSILESGHAQKDWAGDHADWMGQVLEWQKEHPLSWAKGDVLKPQQVVERMYEITKGEAIITTEVGQNQMWAAQFYKYHKPRTYLTSGGLGTMGYGLPAAIGAQLAFPDRLVVDVAGDGSIQMNIQELMTAVENGLPVKILILNNRHLGMVRQWQELFYDANYVATDMKGQPDFVKLADAYGAEGYRITTEEELEELLPKALASPRTAVIDVLVDREENVSPIVPAGASLDEMLIV